AVTGRGEMEAPRLVTLFRDAQRQSRGARVEIVDLGFAPRALAGGDKSLSQREARHGKESSARLVICSVPKRNACMRLAAITCNDLRATYAEMLPTDNDFCRAGACASLQVHAIENYC